METGILSSLVTSISGGTQNFRTVSSVCHWFLLLWRLIATQKGKYRSIKHNQIYLYRSIKTTIMWDTPSLPFVHVSPSLGIAKLPPLRISFNHSKEELKARGHFSAFAIISTVETVYQQLRKWRNYAFTPLIFGSDNISSNKVLREWEILSSQNFYYIKFIYSFLLLL